MARKKKNRNPLDYAVLPEFNLDDRAKRSISLVILLAFGLLSFLGLFNLAGHFGEFIAKWLEVFFGYGKWLIPIIFLYWSLLLINLLKKTLKSTDYLGVFLLFISYQTLFHFFITPANWESAAASGTGGGYLGLYLSKLFFYIFGFWGGVSVLTALFLISLVLVFNTPLTKIIGRESLVAKTLKLFGVFFRNLFYDSSSEDEEENEGQKYISEAREEILSAWQEKSIPAKLEKVEDTVNDLSEVNDDEIINPTAVKKNKIAIQEKIVWPKRNIKIDMPLELLNNKFSKAHGGDIEANRLKIQKTLEKFGIVVEMGETKVGPTVTQYTFCPAEGVKLSRITTLSNDLSLALAAHPIRIEAPIPGQSLVGVEVPNRAKSIVGLREILEDNAFKNRKNNLYVALGKDVAGTAWLYDLTRMPHLLVAGATNSGKSVCLNAIIISLLYQNNPSDLRFIMVDPKRVELPTYNGIPHLLTPVITDANKTINALKWCLNEMERRYDVLSKVNKKNIQSYNAASKEKLPYIVFIIDELADFMMTSGKEMEAAIIRLAQMSRAIGIHLILATQRPSVDVITGLIKANIPTRIAFSVASLVDSKTILDSSGAEKLLGQGDMLFSSAELSKPKRIQGAYLSDTEINDVVSYIKDQAGPADYLEGVTDRQKVGGNAGVGLDGNHGDEDELFEQAQELIINAGKASTSMLQRRLSIGYGRAAKILDMLEDAGIIGQSNGSKPRELMISKEQYENMQENSISGIPVHDRATSLAPDNYLEEEEIDDTEDEVLVFKNEKKVSSEVAEENNNKNNSKEETFVESIDSKEETFVESIDSKEETIVESIDSKEETIAKPINSDDEAVIEELELTDSEEQEVIDDEDEILEDIRKGDKDLIKKEKFKDGSSNNNESGKNKNSIKKPNPLDDDDEMFFAK